MPLPAGDLLQQPGAYRVGPVQRAAADHGEVRLQGAHVGAVLDAPHQVVVGGLVLVDDPVNLPQEGVARPVVELDPRLLDQGVGLGISVSYPVEPPRTGLRGVP